MTTPSHGPQLTIQEVNAWLLEVAERHADIHIKAAHSWNGPHFHEAFVDMAVLFLNAFEAVRVVSMQLCEESQGARSRSIALREQYAQLLEQSLASMERLAQFIPPASEEIHQAESQMREIFQIPLDLVVDRWDSEGEDHAPLDFTFPRHVWLHHPSQKNANNINRLRVYH
jgi:hypothetical protein